MGWWRFLLLWIGLFLFYSIITIFFKEENFWFLFFFFLILVHLFDDWKRHLILLDPIFLLVFEILKNFYHINSGFGHYFFFLQIKYSLSFFFFLIKQFYSYRAYREHLHTITPPCIPYMGIYLTDLTFVLDGNPDRLDEVYFLFLFQYLLIIFFSFHISFFLFSFFLFLSDNKK